MYGSILNFRIRNEKDKYMGRTFFIYQELTTWWQAWWGML
jgi:hypothetical protein